VDAPWLTLDTAMNPAISAVRWQMRYLPAFAAWAWIVIAIFPVIFKYQ
jgi:hypothetical protein